jgi:hypothetical protein
VHCSNTSLSVQMWLIMELLESNLEAKSKIYKDPGLYYIFLINNRGTLFKRLKIVN